MDKNFRNFLIKLVLLVTIIFLTRVLFQFPVEYFGLRLFQQNDLTRLFNKIAGLEVFALVALFFGLYLRNKISKLDHPRFNWKKSVLFIVLAEITVAIYYFIRAAANYYSITSGLSLYLVWIGLLASLALAFIFFTIAVFDWDYLVSFIKIFKKELFIAVIAAIILYNLLILFQDQWLFFSTGVSNILYRLFSLFYQVNYYMGNSGPVIQIGTFGVAIGSPCSGIDSMFLFTAFFAGLFALDHKRLKKGLYILLFIIGFLGVYFVNVIRLFLLILAGIYISPSFAVGLFHTNAGWILFIIYFLCYYLIIKKFIYKSKLPARK
jgi:exosortase/archaeosortase family protein